MHTYMHMAMVSIVSLEKIVIIKTVYAEQREAKIFEKT